MSVFTFKGISSDYYKLKVKTLQPPQRAENTTEYIRIPGRAEPIIKSREEYSNTEITFEVVLNDLSKTRAIFAWLKGEGQLIYSDEPDKYYEAVSNSVISATYISNEIREFQIKFICKPFAYALNAKTVSNTYNNSATRLLRTENIIFENNGTFSCEPVIRLEFCGRLEISVDGTKEKITIDTGEENGTFGSTVTDGYISYDPPEMEIFLDSSLRLAYTAEYNDADEITSRTVVNEFAIGQFPLIPPGPQNITVSLVPKTFPHPSDPYKKYAYYNNLHSIDIAAKERWL